ncbi:hypothetical protein JCM3766R1_005156 [Sporobolomyces carnicolor]
MTDLRRVVHKASRPPAAAREPRPLASSSSSSSSSRPSLNNLRSFKRKTTSGTDSPKPRKAPLPRVTASSTSREYGSTTWTRPAWDTPTRGGPARRAVEDPPDLTSGPKEEAGRDDDGEAPWSIWLRNAIFARQRSLNSKGKQKQVIDDEDEVLVGEQSYESPSDRSLDDEDPPIAAAFFTSNYPVHLPKPCALRVPRRPAQASSTSASTSRDENVSIPTFAAYESESLARKALEGLKARFGVMKKNRFNSKASGSHLGASFSDKPASARKWYGSETIESWEERTRSTAKTDVTKGKERAQTGSAGVPEDAANRSTSRPYASGPSTVRPERRPAPPPPPGPPPPPPPRPAPPSQALLDQLLYELQKCREPPLVHEREPDDQVARQGYILYNPDLDPRKRRKLK